MPDAHQRGVELDVQPLFQKNEPILETHNISGAKVLHLLARAAGHEDTTWGQTQAADGLGLAFCYMRGQYAAVYASNMDLPQRAGPLLGCRFESTWTNDPHEAWEFVTAGLDAGNPIKIAGPEDSVVYAYGDDADESARYVCARGVGGPALEGKHAWEAFAEWIGRWVPLGGGGMYRLAEKTSRPSPQDFVKAVARNAVDWQERHPSVGRFGESSHFGISAFEQFLADLLDPSVEIPDEYINCIAINFQHNARAALGDFFEDASRQLDGPAADLTREAAGHYRAIAGRLQRYVSEGLGRNRETEEGRRAITDVVGGALEVEKKVYACMEKLAGG